MKKKMFILLLIVVVVIGIILGTYFYVAKEKKETNPQKEGKVQETLISSTYFDEETKKLYTMIPDYSTEYNLYQGKKLTVADIPMSVLLGRVYELLKAYHWGEIVASESQMEVSSEDCLMYSGICYVKDFIDADSWVAFEESTMQKYLSYFYGPEVNYERTDYIGSHVDGCNYKDGYYFCSYGGGYAFVPGEEYPISQFYKVEITNNEKYVYTKFVYASFLEQEDETECIDDETDCVDAIYMNLYKDIEKQEKINDNPVLYNVAAGQDPITVAGDNAAIYKHTYKQNSDGSYYWYSVELVEN